MNRSESIAALAAALCAFQKDVKNVKKDSVNPFFKSKYASLDSIWDEVRPILAKNKLALTQFPSGDGELTSVLLHESGEYIEVAAKMSIKEHTPQGQGSAITYMRRYAMSSILGIVTEEDDDGNEASKPVEAKPLAAKSASSPAVGYRCDSVDCKTGLVAKYPKSLCIECYKTSMKGVPMNRKSEGAAYADELKVGADGAPDFS